MCVLLDPNTPNEKFSVIPDKEHAVSAAIVLKVVDKAIEILSECSDRSENPNSTYLIIKNADRKIYLNKTKLVEKINEILRTNLKKLTVEQKKMIPNYLLACGSFIFSFKNDNNKGVDDVYKEYSMKCEQIIDVSHKLSSTTNNSLNKSPLVQAALLLTL